MEAKKIKRKRKIFKLKDLEEWSYEKYMQLFALVKAEPCLWSKTDQNHATRSKIDSAMKIIAETLECSIAEMLARWRSMRQTFNKYLQREQRIKSGNGGKSARYKEWRFMSALRFLEYDVTLNSRNDKLVPQSPAFVAVETKKSPALTHKIPNNVPSTNTSVPSRDRKRSRDFDQAINSLSTMSKKLNQEETSFDVFGKNVVVQLKNLSFENALIAQQKIQCILSEIGIKDYREKTRSTTPLTSCTYDSLRSPASVTESQYNDNNSSTVQNNQYILENTTYSPAEALALNEFLTKLRQKDQDCDEEDIII